MIRFNPITNNPPKPSFKASQSVQNRYGFSEKAEQDSFQMSVGYVNDIHGQTNNQLRILSGLEGDLRLSGGDDQIGNEKNKATNQVTVSFLDAANITARAMGNHEMDTNLKDFCNLNAGHNTHLLAANIREKEDCADKTDFNEIKKDSIVTEINGEKVGLIGACPNDLHERIMNPDVIKDCELDDYPTTVNRIDAEVKKLVSQGVNKIFLLSHLGHEKNVDIAKKVEGIDVIIGGHSHELFKDIKEGKNLIYSSNGTPVVITQAGKDGHHFGLLNLEFNKDGVITKAQNNILKTRDFPKNYVHEYLANQYLGKPEIVGEIKSVVPIPEDALIGENPHSNFICDAMREITGADIALWNNAATRNSFHVGKVNNREIKDIAPFADDMTVIPLSEKEIVDGFNLAIKRSLSRDNHKPGFHSVSGLNYTVSKSKKALVEMNFIDKEGNVHPIDVENPRADKVYKVATDTFIATGGDDIPMFNKLNEAYKNYPYSKNVMVCDYLKQQTEPVEINQTGRVKVID